MSTMDSETTVDAPLIESIDALPTVFSDVPPEIEAASVGIDVPVESKALPDASTAVEGKPAIEVSAKPHVVTPDAVRAALRQFYQQLVWTAEDQDALWKKRGLTALTAGALGFRSNRPENERVIRELMESHEEDVLLRAGLVERVGSNEDAPVRPSRNLCGFGEVAKVKLRGRSRQVVEQELKQKFAAFEPLSFWVPAKGDELHAFGMNRAPIIPYFDYIPSAPTSTYDLVILTEGEFKAAALWQIYAEFDWGISPPLAENLIGIRTHKMWAKGARPDAYMTPPCGGTMRWNGRDMRVGFIAVPGIQFVVPRGATWQVSHQIKEFISRHGARDAVVMFDNEEKGDPKLPGYNPDVSKRFDAVAYGLVAARHLSRNYIHGRFAMIPDRYRNKNGKADFDGALREMIKETPAK